VLRTSDFDYPLPPDRIAQRPNEPRDRSRLMIVERATERIGHGVFADLAHLIPAGDLLVVNSTRVIRARLTGQRNSGAPAEVLLLHPMPEAGVFEAMVHPGGKLRPGRVVHVAPELDVEILSTTERRTRLEIDADLIIEMIYGLIWKQFSLVGFDKDMFLQRINDGMTIIKNGIAIAAPK
jgi:S-adenosylmethionine:tRNA ribosyltransferase-isomerase